MEPVSVPVQSLQGGQNQNRGLDRSVQTNAGEQGLGRRQNVNGEQNLDGQQSQGRGRPVRRINPFGRQNSGRNLNIIERNNLGQGNNFGRQNLGRGQSFGGAQAVVAPVQSATPDGLGGLGASGGGSSTSSGDDAALPFDINKFFGLGETNSGSLGQQSSGNDGNAYSSTASGTAPSNDSALPLSASVPVSSGPAGGTKGY